MESYDRALDLKTGETVRRVVWAAPNGRRYRLVFSRFVSMQRLHLIAQKLSVTPLDGPMTLDIAGGINGQMNNSGSQHFSEGDKRLYEGRHMQYNQTTEQSGIHFVFNTTFSFAMDGQPRDEKGFIIMERRIIKQEFKLDIPAGSTLTVQKLSTVYTSRDKDSESLDAAALQAKALAGQEEACALGYDALLAESAAAWAAKVWDNVPVTIQAADPFDQMAIRFAQYHLYVMTPAHDNRMNVGAKGLSGEGYKGHTFWDTEMFVLPYFIYSDPAIARSLEEYRWLSLPGAHKKAAANNYQGAQFPWEAAWIDDGRLHINDVVGPDEYKEHVDDNAFTNYMAAWNIRKALEYSRQLKAEKPDLYRALDAKLGLAALEPQWEEKLSRLYLPQPREDLVIPQDRTYLTLKDIDLTKYKNQQNVGSIYRDYNQEQITHMQVSKQADILIMFLLLEDEFSAEVKRANWSYYEPRTLHDSSLSLSTHCILASDMGSRELAYQLFRSAAAIDVGPNMKTSDAGMFPFFGSLGVMDPLDPAEYELDAFYPNLVEAFTNDQGTLCVPKDVSSLATYYNIDLLEACGYTADDIPDDYADYMAFLTDLQAKLDEVYGPNQIAAMTYNQDLSRNLCILQDGGNSLIDAEGNATLTSDGIVKNMQSVASAWIKYVPSVEGETIWGTGAACLPPRADAAEAMDVESDPVWAVHSAMIDCALPWQLGNNASIINTAYQNYFPLAVNGEMTAAVFVVYLSFHKVNLFTDSYTFVGLENYTRLFTDNMARTALTNTLQKFTNITIPYLKPITTYVLLTGIIGTLQMFDQAYIFSNGSGGPANSTLTVSLLVYRYAFGPNNAMGYAATIAIILAAVIMIVSMIAEKLNSHRTDPSLGGQHRQHLPDAAVLHQLPQGRV